MKTKQTKPVTKDMFPPSCLVALSGGLHSTIALFWALHADIGTVKAISFYHGQKTQHELTAARKVAELAGVKHRIVRLPAPYDMQNDQLRNVAMAAVAADCVVTDGGTAICMGVKNNTSSCSSNAYSRDLQNVLWCAANNINLKFHAPLISMNNADMILLAYHLPGCWNALAYTHTSADDYGVLDNAEGFPLLKNPKNNARANAFVDAGMPDPLVYRAIRAEKMAPPDTPNYTVTKIEQFCERLK